MLKRYSTISACRPVKCADWPTVEEIDQLLTCGGRNRLLQMQMGLFISLSLPDPLTFPTHHQTNSILSLLSCLDNFVPHPLQLFATGYLFLWNKLE